MARIHIFILLVGFFVVSCGPAQRTNGVGQHQVIMDPKVIYGQDDRRDLYDIQDAKILALADSTVALVYSSNLSNLNNGYWSVGGVNFGKDFNLCQNEPFRDQNTSAFCSGFLVAPDIMVSAGHCISDEYDCKGTSFLFGFAIKKKGVFPNQISENDIYSCREVLHTQQPGNAADFSVIRLDRPVTNHAPLSLRTSGVPSPGDKMMVIGHPSGLPTKVASGANVRSIQTGYFMANLDTYGGNSGSAVFNVTTGKVEGVLVRGETDFVMQGSCNVSNRCPENGCRGEDVTLITEAEKYIPFE